MGRIIFCSNYGSAINAEASDITISSGSRIQFFNNTGFDGGAISLHGPSRLQLNKNTSVGFLSNKAINTGGAIYQMDEEVRPWKLCTIVEDDRSEEHGTINLHFNNNFAEVGGNSIFASSIPFGECSSAMALNLRSCNGNLKYPPSMNVEGMKLRHFTKFSKEIKIKALLK